MTRSKSIPTYLLIVLSLSVILWLQIVWLRQLFMAQQEQLTTELEALVSKTAQAVKFKSMTTIPDPGNLRQLRQLILSPEWAQLREAFENMNAVGLTSSSVMNVSNDSTVINMQFILSDSGVNNEKYPSTTGTGMTPEQLAASDSIALNDMKNTTVIELTKTGITTDIYYTIFDFNQKNIVSTTLPPGVRPSFSSKTYHYDFQNIHRYQLNLATINHIVWYRMRYYIASSIFMFVLTIAAFYFIVTLLKKQRIYADAKSDFTSNITHEFKTPIATIAVALESIQKYDLINEPRTLQNYLDIGRHELTRLDLMVEKVLNLGNGVETEQPLNKELYDVQTGLQQVIASMKLQLPDSDSGIIFEKLPDPCFVFGDPIHLTNVFYNLVDNAIKHSGKKLLLKVNCKQENDNIIISFQDDGTGIEKIYQRKIFERFFRIPSTGSTHNSRGSGLGLHYVKQIVERHGGRMVLQSEPGRGSNFIVNLPSAE